MLIHNADITGSLTINGIPYNTGSYTGIFKSGTNIISGNTVILTGSFTGSFLGDGSQLSGVTSYTDADTLDFINSLNVVSGSIQTLSTVSDTFTSVTSYTVTHNFGTKQVIVSVYENDTLIFPSSINTPTTNTVTITFPEPVTGRVVVVKAGHVVSGSINYTSVLNKPTLVSGSAQISFTGITNKPTLISGSAQIAALGYATTGSNQFKASQVITGSLTVTDAIIAQTLNVQQVTSSVIFSSGSNVFGNSLGNTQQFTGSLQVSGSSHNILGNVGMGTTSPAARLQIIRDGTGSSNTSLDGSQLILSRTTGNSENIVFRNTGASNGISGTSYAGQIISHGNNILEIYTNVSNPIIFGTDATERMRITPSGSIEIGTTGISSPSGADRFIGIYGAQDSSLILQDNVQTWELYVNDDFYINRGSTNVLTLNRTTGTSTFTSNSGIRVGSTDGGRVFIRQSAGGDAEIGANANGGLFLYANNVLGLSFTGAAATFSSTVQSVGVLSSGNAGATTGQIIVESGANAASRRWKLLTSQNVNGDFVIQQSTTQTGSTFADILGFNASGAATFASSVTVNGDVYINNSSNAQIGFNTTGASGVGAYLYFNRSSVNKWTAGMGPYTGGNNYEIVTGSVVALSLAVTTGVATFSTTENQGGVYVTSATDNTTLRVSSTAANGQEWRMQSTGGTSGLGAGKLVFKVGGTETAAHIPLTLTTDNSTNGGRVGIGTTTPGHKIDVLGASGNITSDMGNGTIINIDGGSITSTNFGVGIGFVRTGSQMAYIKAARENTSDEAGYLAFATQTGAGSHPERMRITSGGDVRINFNPGAANGLYFNDATSSAAMLYIIPAIYTGSAPYNSNRILAANSSNLSFETGGGEKMRITSGGAMFNRASTAGHTAFIGAIGPGNVGNRYLHVRINTIQNMMVWIKIFGYVYATAIIEGLSGGYVDGSTGGVAQAFQNGSIVAQYQSSSYLEIVVDTANTGTSNRWGSISFMGGTDSIVTIQPLEIMAYSWTSTTTRVY